MDGMKEGRYGEQDRVISEVKSEVKKLLVEEIPYFSGILGALLVLLLIAFYKSVTSAIIMWVFLSLEFVLVGYLIGILLPLDRLERTVIGIVSAIASFGILSYFLGLIGIHVKYHSYVIFGIEIIVLIIGGLYFSISKKIAVDKDNLQEKVEDNKLVDKNSVNEKHDNEKI